jgi:hypothetical protein
MYAQLEQTGTKGLSVAEVAQPYARQSRPDACGTRPVSQPAEPLREGRVAVCGQIHLYGDGLNFWHEANVAYVPQYDKTRAASNGEAGANMESTNLTGNQAVSTVDRWILERLDG